MFNLSVIVRQLLVTAGAVMMVWGVTMPILGMKIFRDESFYDLSPTGALILTSLAVISVLVAVFRKWWGLYITSILSLALLFYTVGEIQNRKASMDAEMKQHIAGGPLANTMRGLVNATRVRHGFLVMAGGAVAIGVVPLVWGRVVFRRKSSASTQVQSGP